MILASTTAAADDWPAERPQGWHAVGDTKVAEMWTKKTRHNAGDKSIVYVFDVTLGHGYAVRAKLLWTGPLVNRDAPYEAILSSAGHLVTLDDWGNLGYDNAVVIYDPKGKLVAQRKLDNLLPTNVANRDRSKSSRYWRRDAKYYFDLKKQVVRIVMKGGEALDLSLVDGSPTFYTATPTSAGFEETRILPLDLRFASLTDVHAANSKPATAKQPPPPKPRLKPNPF
jgi:hypothetical protein